MRALPRLVFPVRRSMEPQNIIKGRTAVPEPGTQLGDPGAPDIRNAQPGAPQRLGAQASNWGRANWLLVAGIVAGLTARIVFWAVTDRRIDDALITIKFDRNLADGFGLVHNLGEGHVHGFTSSLSVLVPMPGELVAAGGGLLLIRLVSLAAFVVTAVYAYRICREFEVGPWPVGLVLAYLAFDQNQVFYGMSGLETQIAVGVLLAGIYYVLLEDYAKSGVLLALALLARPDFILWVVPAYAFLFFHDRRGALRAGVICAVILAPWVIFTTIYYGSPIPNTISAKSATFAPVFPSLTDFGGWIDFLRNTLSKHGDEWKVLAPFFERAQIVKAPWAGWLLETISLTVVGLALIGAATTWKRASWRPAIAFVVLFALYKVIYMSVGYFQWYGVPPLAVLFILAGIGLDRASKFLSGSLSGRITITPAKLAAVPVVLLAFAYAFQLRSMIPLEDTVQHKIEDKVRVPLAQFIGREVKTGETLTSESSGYVGYYTNATLYDWPGLESPTVVDAIRDAHAGWGQQPKVGYSSPMVVAYLLQPDWLVLRPQELEWFKQQHPFAASHYRPVREFSVPPGENVDLSVGGVVIWSFDLEFVVLRRTDAISGSSRANAAATAAPQS
jgi:hypothetical protein